MTTDSQTKVEDADEPQDQRPQEALENVDDEGEVPVGVSDAILLEEILAGESPFRSNGQARIAVTKDGVKRTMIVPIRSVDMDQMMRRTGLKQPIPPSKPMKVEKGSKLALDAGVPDGGLIMVPDLGDENYLRDLEEYSAHHTLSTILHGLAVDIKDGEGKLVWSGNPKGKRNPEDMMRALEVLEEAGLTASQFQDIMRAINQLTVREEAVIEGNSVGSRASLRI